MVTELIEALQGAVKTKSIELRTAIVKQATKFAKEVDGKDLTSNQIDEIENLGEALKQED